MTRLTLAFSRFARSPSCLLLVEEALLDSQKLPTRFSFFQFHIFTFHCFSSFYHNLLTLQTGGEVLTCALCTSSRNQNLLGSTRKYFLLPRSLLANLFLFQHQTRKFHHLFGNIYFIKLYDLLDFMKNTSHSFPRHFSN